MITIRRAVYEDIPAIMKFIDEHWKKNHILARDRDFFEWQYVDADTVNMYIAIDDELEKIYGIEGIIRYNQTDSPDISGGVWKTIKSPNPLLGIELTDYLWNDMNVRYGCSAGINEKAMKIYELQGMIPTQMDHYYRLNDLGEYKIAKVAKKHIPAIEDNGYVLEAIISVEQMREIISEDVLRAHILSKDYHYIQRRYFEHPIYKYELWKICNANGESDSVIITREQKVGSDKCLKIIDYYGNIERMSQLGVPLSRLMEERNYEFVSVYSYGVPVEFYERAGFLSCGETDENTIPNYFYPFEQRNVVIRLCDPQIDGIRIFLGDGDQDRPC